MNRSWFRPAALAAGGFALVAGLGLAWAEARGWPFLRAPLEQRVAAALGVPVRLEDGFTLKLIGAPRLAVGHLHIGAGGGLGAAVPHLVEARRLQIDVRWRDLWRAWRGDALRVQRLVADELDARLVRGADGRASWQLGRLRDTQAEPGADPVWPRFGWLAVQRGQLVLDDAVSDTRLAVQLQGGEGQGGEAGGGRAGYRASVAGRWHALPLQLQLAAGAALPLVQDAEAAAAAPLVPLRVQGRAGAAEVLFDGKVGALLGERRLDGALRIAGPSLAPVGVPLGLTLPETPPFVLEGRLDHAGGLWHLQAERATIGRSRLGGDLRYDTRQRPAQLTGRVAGPRLALADLGPAIGAGGPSASAGRVLPQRRFDLPSLRGMTADVMVAIDELDLGSTALAPLRGLRTQVVLAGGVLELRALQAVVAGGRIAGSTRLDARQEPATWSADLRFDGVDIAGALPAVRTRPREGTRGPRAYVTGTLAGSLQATGRGRSTAELLATLDGRVQALLRNGTLSHLVTEAAGIDVAQALGVLVRGDDALPLRCARVDLAIRNGVLRPTTAVLDNEDSTLRVVGQVDLRNETLALQARVRPKDFSPLSLRTPVTVTGTLARPEVGVDSRKLAGKLLGAVVLGAVAAPLAALLPLVDPGDGEKGDPCAGP